MADSLPIFFDVGGVLLTNGWDTPLRDRAVAKFGLDAHDFHTRHAMVVTAFESGRLSLSQYLQRTVFYRPRSFTPDEFKQFMFDQSQELPDSALPIVRTLARNHRLCVLSNESLELNDHRIRKFGLAEVFQAFFSSCYLGMVKPNEDIYKAVLLITRCPPGQAIFIDDRAINVEAAQAAGFQAVQYQGSAALRQFLEQQGIKV